MLEFHHVGVLVENIESTINDYSKLFGSDNISEIFTISSQKVKVCFVKVSESNYLELVQSIADDSVVQNLIKKRISYYHVGYIVQQLDSMLNQLENDGYKLINTFDSEAFNGKKCAFLFNPDGHLMELIQA